LVPLPSPLDKRRVGSISRERAQGVRLRVLYRQREDGKRCEEGNHREGPPTVNSARSGAVQARHSVCPSTFQKSLPRGTSLTELTSATAVSEVSNVQSTAPSASYSLRRYRAARGTPDQTNRWTRATDARGATGMGATAVVSVVSLRLGVESSSPPRDTNSKASAAAAASPSGNDQRRHKRPAGARAAPESSGASVGSASRRPAAWTTDRQRAQLKRCATTGARVSLPKRPATKSAIVRSSRQSSVSVARSNDTGARNNPAASLSRAISARQVEQASTCRAVAGSPPPRAWGTRDSGRGWVMRPLPSMAIRIGPVIRTVGSGLLAHVSQVSSFDPCLLEARANRCECPIHMVVDRLGVGVPEGTGYLLGGHLIDDVQPDGEAVVGGERFQSGGQDLLLLGEGCRIGGGFLVFRRGGRGECGGAPATARARRAVGGGELLQEVAERERSEEGRVGKEWRSRAAPYH